MEGKNFYSCSALGYQGSGSQMAQLQQYSDSGLSKCRFLKAYVTQERAAGLCRLFLIWQRGRSRKSLEVHRYLLRFDYQGIEEYEIRDITYLGLHGWEKRLDCPVMAIGLAEAVSLIKDAYEQNKRYQSKTPPGIDPGHFMLDFDSQNVERGILSRRLLPARLNVAMFVNIYLAALRRHDLGLLYDLSGKERQCRLGTRQEYLSSYADEMSCCTFLRTGISMLETKGSVSRVKVNSVLSNSQEELLRICCEFTILGEDGCYQVKEVTELTREVLTPIHPDNPLEYPVFAVLYRHNCKEELARWLEAQPGVFISGELNAGENYKWLNGGAEPWEEYDCTHSTSAEFYLAQEELLVFSKQPEKLAGISRLLTEDLQDRLLLQGQYYLLNSDVIAAMVGADGWPVPAKLAYSLQDKSVQSYIILLEARQKTRFLALLGKMAAKTIKLGCGASYYVLKDQELLADYYAVGSWLKLNIYQGDESRLLALIRNRFQPVDIIKSSELENQYDLFTPPLSDQRKWVIFRRLRQLGKEAALMRNMGLVPSVKMAAKQLGVVI